MKTQFQTFYYIHIIKIPTNKGSNSCKLKISKIGNRFNKKPLKTDCQRSPNTYLI